MNDHHPPRSTAFPMATLRSWAAIAALCVAAAIAGLQSAHAVPDGRFTGYIQPFKLIKVSAAESGILSELLVKEGDQVQQGQVLAKLDARVLESDRAIAREELGRLTMRYERLAALEKSRDAAPEEVERAKSEMTIQQLRLQRIDTQLENYVVRSPVTGLVAEVKVDISESVGAASTHLLTLVQMDKMLLNLPLPADQAKSFKAGETVPLYLFDRNENLSGMVEFVSPLVDPATGTVRVKFLIDNAAGDLQSGLRCGLRDPVKAATVPANGKAERGTRNP